MIQPGSLTSAKREAQYCFEWQHHRVSISGCSEDIASELSEILALETHPACASDDNDILITRSGAITEGLLQGGTLPP